MIGIAALLAGAAAVAPPPASVAPPKVAVPASSDDEIWAIASRVGTAEAYRLYLQRFGPNGAHVAEAYVALRALIGAIAAPPAPPAPPPPPPPPVTLVPGPADPCISLYVDQKLGQRDTPEGRAWLAARRSNRVSAYQAFAAAMPSGVCAAQARQTIARRAEWRSVFKDVPGFGPIEPRLLRPRTLEQDDYPPRALRLEQQGRVKVRFAVAEDGTVEDCRVDVSSGHAELDEDTCDLVTIRFRYDPARDAAGRPIRSAASRSFQWQIEPDQTPPTAPPPPRP
jgi:TonB family protein